jgi:hypothetical protein
MMQSVPEAPMADETQNPAIQVSSGITSVLTGVWDALAKSEASWRGLIGLTLILGFILLYQGKLSAPPAPTAPPVKQDNAQVLSALLNLKNDIAALKAQLTATAGEIGEQLDNLKVVPVVKPRPKKQPISAMAP